MGDLAAKSQPTVLFTGYPPFSLHGKAPFILPKTNRQCETAYWIYGELAPSITPLIVAHGGPGFPHYNILPFARLSEPPENRTIIFYDQLGCGASTHLPDTKGDTDFWTLDLFRAELENLISHLRLQQYDLLGHSFGGLIACEFALLQPKGLRTLILFSTDADMPMRQAMSLRRRSALDPSTVAVFERCEADGTTDSAEYKAAMQVWMQTHLCRLDPWPEPLRVAAEESSKDDTVISTMYPDPPFALTGIGNQWSVLDQLPQITEQTLPGGLLVLNGKHDLNSDGVVAPFLERTGKGLRKQWMVFEESSHMAMYEEEDKVLTTISEFLRGS